MSPRSAGRVWPLALALWCLVAPLVTMAVVRLVDASLLDQVVRIYSTFDQRPFESHAIMSRHNEPLGPYALGGFRDFLEIIGVETLARTWNVLAPGALLAALLMLAAVAIHLGARRRRWGVGLQAAVFGGVAAALGCALWPSPYALLLAACCWPGFILGFSRAGAATRLVRDRRPGQLLMALAATTGLTHLWGVVVLLRLVAHGLAPQSRRLACLASWGGRLLLGLVCFFPLALGFLSLRPVELSPRATLLLPQRELYDLELDAPGDRLLVTRKWRTRPRGGAYALKLGDLSAPPRRIDMPVMQVEDIALDRTGRRIYTIGFDSRQLITMDADSFAVLGRRQLSRRGRGGFYLDVAPSVGRIFAAWELDLLAAYELSSGEGRFLDINPLVHGATNLCCDEANGVVYFTAGELAHGYQGYGGNPTLAVVQMRTLEVKQRVPAPLSDRMTLAPARRELLISDLWGSCVWIYRTPSMKLLRKVPTQFAVRPLAVDQRHSLLVVGGVVTGYLEVIDLRDGRTIQRDYVGPYCRRIALDTRRRHAFVTSARAGLFVVKY